MDKKLLLEKLKAEMALDNALPLKKGATQLVFADGNPESNILCIGEGPGYWEDQKGLPFVGNAGKLLDKFLKLINLGRNDVYITNVVHHRPPENRDPLPEEIAAYGVYLDKIIDIVQPEIIITLGRFSMGKFLPGVTITKVHGKEQNISWKGRKIIIVPMYHPAAALRNGEILRAENDDFLKLSELLTKLNDKIEEEKENPSAEQIGLL